MKIIKNQEKFFDINAQRKKEKFKQELYEEYINKEINDGFKWLQGSKKILDYGCGTGTSIELYRKLSLDKNELFCGVDIAAAAVEKAKQNYPEDIFIRVLNNDLSSIESNTFNAAYILHVLHHTNSNDHSKIFAEIYRVLNLGGKLFISDLSSSNPIIKFARMIFIYAPLSIKNKFSDDLVVDGLIPEKLKVDLRQLIKILEENGFRNIEVKHGHLFSFVYIWIDKFTNISKLSIFRKLYNSMINFEIKLCNNNFFKKYCEVISIKAIK
jgi:ubiquinone/menaquinone biosynthesis C-methylase UbiE